jgi:Tol biopolymer transport system component
VKTTRGDIWLLPLAGDRKARPLLQSPFTESHGQLSPDGRWLAYTSNESGPGEVMVRSASPGGGKWVISNDSGAAPRWRGDSGELFYVGSGKMWSVALSSRGTELVPMSAKPLFDQRGIDNSVGHPAYFSYDVTKDGQRFLTSRRSSGGENAPDKATIVVVLNWFGGVRR